MDLSGGNTVTGNTLTDNSYGITASRNSSEHVISSNQIFGSIAYGLAVNGEPCEITGNTIRDGQGVGISLGSTVGASVHHNNISGNAGEQLRATVAVELSSNSEGNYWGRQCPDALFIAGVDTNSADVVDSFPYGSESAWLNGQSPGCGPPDADGDGYDAGVDCDDADPLIYPGAIEVCDLVDNDCDGTADEDLGTTTCGLGQCEHTVDNCVDGIEQTCDPLEGAADEVCDLADNDCDGLVDDAATLQVRASHHVVDGGSHPSSSKSPLVGLQVGVYDKADGSCARDLCGGVSWQQYECIVNTCVPTALDETDAYGEIEYELPAGDYLVIGDDGTDKHLGVSASELACGDMMRKYLQRLETFDGKLHAGKTTRRTGSELLIVEPEYVEWTGAEELYPFVLESAGDWSITTSVAPPDGFISDHDSLSEEVNDELESVQFTLTDVGSDWVPTGVRHSIQHDGRNESIVSRIGVLVAPGLALEKGLDRYGHPLDADGRPMLGSGFDPRAPRPAEIVGWIEPSPTDPTWVIKVVVDQTCSVTLAVTKGNAVTTRTLFEGTLSSGEWQFDWDGLSANGADLDPGRYWLTLTAGDYVQRELLTEP